MVSATSVQELRANLSSFLKRAEEGDVVKITRCGHEVAVLISVDVYEQFIAQRASFTQSLASFYQRYGAPEGDLASALEEIREPSEGREVSFD